MLKAFSTFFTAGILLALCLVPVSATQAVQPKIPEVISFHPVRLSKSAPLGIYGCVTAGLINGAFYTLAPVFGHRIGMTVSEIALFMAITVFSGLALQWPVGLLSDRFDRSSVMAWIGLAVSAFSVGIVLAGNRSSVLLVVLTALYGGTAFTIYPVAVAHTHDFFEPHRIVSVSAALILSFGIGACIGPVAGALMMDAFGPAGLYLFIAFASGIFGATVALYRKQKPERLAVESPVPFVAMPLRTTSPLVAVLDPRSGHEEQEGGRGAR
jgi:MFS family permease